MRSPGGRASKAGASLVSRRCSAACSRAGPPQPGCCHAPWADRGWRWRRQLPPSLQTRLQPGQRLPSSGSASASSTRCTRSRGRRPQRQQRQSRARDSGQARACSACPAALAPRSAESAGTALQELPPGLKSLDCAGRRCPEYPIVFGPSCRVRSLQRLCQPSGIPSRPKWSETLPTPFDKAFQGSRWQCATWNFASGQLEFWAGHPERCRHAGRGKPESAAHSEDLKETWRIAMECSFEESGWCAHSATQTRHAHSGP
mmetsp:Transcript_95805/g.280058  ORF Transcript_95805/g.280058 Transcript_95805/m.280058 type:complete len:259 (+) Transcript_95805:445-1221(+)